MRVRNIDYDGDSKNDFMSEPLYQLWQIEVLNECWRILKPNGSIFYNHKIRTAQHRSTHPISWISKTNLTFRQQIVWNRLNSPNVSKIRYLPTTELIFWLTKTNCQPNFELSKKSIFNSEVWTLSAKPTKNTPRHSP